MGVSRRLLLLAAISTVAAAKKKKKRGKKAVTLGLLSGTAFQPSGLSFPGVEITARLKEGDGKDLWRAITDGRGEYALRVPATVEGVQYRLVAEVKGLPAMEREVWAYEAQRTSANFRFRPPENAGTQR